MQQLVPEAGGPHNPNSHTEATILRALRGLDGSRRLTFRYELLDTTNMVLRALDEVVSGRISLNNLADIKRTASFRLRSTGTIDWLSDRIKPWVRLHLPPYGADDFVEWPQGVFLPVTPRRDADTTSTVWRDIDAYDQGQIVADDQIPTRYSTDGLLDLEDDFLRDVVDGWGSLDSGEEWTFVTTADTTRGVSSTGGGYGWVQLLADPGTLRLQSPGGLRYSDIEVFARVAVDQTATGNSLLPAIITRYVDGANFYRLRLHMLTTGSVSMSVTRTVTQIGATEDTGLTYAPGDWFNLRCRVIGHTVYGKVWADGATEPDDWLIERDITSDQISQGSAGLSASGFSTNTNTNPELRYEFFEADANPLDLYTRHVERALEDAGITDHNITPSTERLLSVREWEPGTSRLEIINDLLAAISYRSLSFDEHGTAVGVPYVSPQERAAEYTYADDSVSVMLTPASQELDLHAIPNQWVLSKSEADEPAATITFTNSDPASPTSTVRRGRTITDFRTETDAASESALIEKAARIAFESSQVYESVDIDTALIPIHSHDDVVHVRRDDLAIDDKYASHTWDMELSAGATMSHRVRRVVSLAAGSDPSIVVGDAEITGALEAGNLAFDEVLVTPVASTPTSHTITGLGLSGTGPVRVQATPRSSVPGSTFHEVGIRNPTPDGFVIWVYRTNTTTTGINYLAVRHP